MCAASMPNPKLGWFYRHDAVYCHKVLFNRGRTVFSGRLASLLAKGQSVSSSAAYLSPFLAAFPAATIILAQSKAGLTALILTSENNVILLVAVLGIGNVLGAVVNWYLGHRINRFSDRRLFPIKPAKLSRATLRYHKYGRWSLLLSWVSFIGDPITIAAGVLREPLLSFLLIVSFAKTTRYILVAVITLKLI